MRENKRRYILFKWRSKTSLNQNSLSNALWLSVMKLYGEIGASQTNLRIIEWSGESSFFIVRCTHRAVDMIRAAAATVREVENQPSVLYSLGVSGTIKALKEKFLVKSEQKPF